MLRPWPDPCLASLMKLLYRDEGGKLHNPALIPSFWLWIQCETLCSHLTSRMLPWQRHHTVACTQVASPAPPDVLAASPASERLLPTRSAHMRGTVAVRGCPSGRCHLQLALVPMVVETYQPCTSREPWFSSVITSWGTHQCGTATDSFKLRHSGLGS